MHSVSIAFFSDNACHCRVSRDVLCVSLAVTDNPSNSGERDKRAVPIATLCDNITGNNIN